MISKLTQAVKGLLKKRRETVIDGSRRLFMLGRGEFKYIDGDRSMIVFIELLSGKPERAIHVSSIKNWLPPHEDQIISDQERQQIANAIAQAFTSRGRSVTLWSG